MTHKIKTKNPTLSHWLPTLAITIIAGLTMWYTFTHFIELSLFGILAAKVAIGLTLASLVDNFVLREFDTVYEIKSGNVAFALLYLGYILVVLAALIST